MATSTGDNIPVKKMIHVYPMNFISDMAADIWLTIGLTLLTIAFIYWPEFSGTILRSALGIAMVLFMPGYALISALFPGKKSMRGIERIVLSFGFSISIVPLMGLALNATSWGIRLDPMVAIVSFFTVACALMANWRRLELPKEARFHVDLMGTIRSVVSDIRQDGTQLDMVLTVILFLVIIVAGATIMHVLGMPDKGETYTEFYILGPDGMADNYPIKYLRGDEKTIIVGVANHEQRNMTYDLSVILNDLNNSTISTLHSEQLKLSDGETREKDINLTPDRVGIGMKIEFLLYAEGNTSAPYKECYLWANVTDPTPKPTMRPTVKPTIRPTLKPTMNPLSASGIDYNRSIYTMKSR